MAYRVCDVCAGIDEEPRHVMAFGPDEAPTVPHDITVRVIADENATPEQKAEALQSLGDGTLQIRHIPCCARVGCPSGTCTA